MREEGKEGRRAGTLYLVATPIGNLEDITYRAVRILGEVDLIAAEDTRAARVLLGHYGIDKPLLSVHDVNEAERAGQVAARLARGEAVALISEAGTPGVSDPGYRVVRAALEVGAAVVPIPGPSAVLAALTASGLPTDRFAFHGFPPRKEGPRQELFGRLRGEPATHVFYEAPGRVGETLADLVRSFGAARPAALARELTKRFEEIARGTLGELAQRFAVEPPRGEVALVVGGAADGDAAPVDLEAEVAAALARGESPREIAAALAARTGRPRRVLYQLALARKGRT